MANRASRAHGSRELCSQSHWVVGCAKPSHPESAGAAEPYVPGLGEIMSATQMRHLKLWYAGQAGNWPLAAYEVDELEEGFAAALASILGTRILPSRSRN